MRKITTLKGLKGAVKEIAGGEYHVARQKIVEYSDGEVRVKWDAYINNLAWTRDHNSPQGVISELKEGKNEKNYYFEGIEKSS